MSCAVLTSLKLTGSWRANCEFPYSHQTCPHGWGRKGSHQASFPLSQASSTSPSAQPTGFHFPASPRNDSSKSIVSSHKNQGFPHPLVTTKPVSQPPACSPLTAFSVFLPQAVGMRYQYTSVEVSFPGLDIVHLVISIASRWELPVTSGVVKRWIKYLL